ncbi:MAG: hypothetical protein WA324_25995 [Bryobacteraceae bacterium]|jgi:hypothetical protein
MIVLPIPSSIWVADWSPYNTVPASSKLIAKPTALTRGLTEVFAIGQWFSFLDRSNGTTAIIMVEITGPA